MSLTHISVRGAREHNLKNVDVNIPKDQLTVITGVSGSGKSSLAFDTIYAEGQRRYVESLSAYARQFLDMQNKPDVDHIEGLSPAISIEQKTTSKNPRSTVGTVTEIYDYLRVLYARIGVPYSPATGLPIESQTVSQMVDRILAMKAGTRLMLLAPIVRGRKGEYKKELKELMAKGFQRVKIDGKLCDIAAAPDLDKKFKHDISVVVDRIVVKADLGHRLPDSIETALKLADGLLIAEDADSGDQTLFSSKFACPVSGFTIAEIEPRLFSFNSPHGACPECDGLGEQLYFDEELVVPDTGLSIKEGAIAAWKGPAISFYAQAVNAILKAHKADDKTPWAKLPKKVRDVILNGSGDEEYTYSFNDGTRKFQTTKPFEGVIPSLDRRWKDTQSDWMRGELEQVQNSHPCPACNGARLKPEALAVKVGSYIPLSRKGRGSRIADMANTSATSPLAGEGLKTSAYEAQQSKSLVFKGEGALNIAEVTAMSIKDINEWVQTLPKQLTPQQKKIGERLLREIAERLGFLVNVGLDYLTLSRSAGTLSGGESQRIRLASQIGSGLTGVLYVLDEPSIGLHQRDNDRLLTALKRLRDLGNTVLVVEHDEDAIRTADYLIDMGPAAGVHGGTVVAEGVPAAVIANPNSVTGQYLSGTKFIPVPTARRAGHPKQFLEVVKATGNNLQNISVQIPLGTFTCVTGVSGGGKSTLVIDTLYKALARKVMGAHEHPAPHGAIKGVEYIDKVIDIDQSPIGRTPRSNPATYTGVFTPIRDWFAGLPEAKARGYGPGRFSFNVKGGRCEACEGDGVLTVEMHFLPDVYVTCDTCAGKRYNRETLEVTYRDKTIADVLDMSVEEGHAFFAAVPSIRDKLQTLIQVGLGYIKIGQQATTLSGGEAQRVKLAKELSRRATGRTLYILDEPTTGLHFADVQKLLEVLHKLVDTGNTVLVIEHNLEVIKTADWLIDLGPEGGAGGGRIVAAGTPEDVADVAASYTGKYLKPYLQVKRKRMRA